MQIVIFAVNSWSWQYFSGFPEEKLKFTAIFPWQGSRYNNNSYL